MLGTRLMPGSCFGSAPCLVCNAKSNPNKDSSWAFRGAGEFSNISCSPGLSQLLYMSHDGLGTALCSAHSSSREQGERQSHPFTALGPRDDAGGQLKLSGMPDALNSPVNSQPCPLRGLPWWQLLSLLGGGDQQKMVCIL